MINTNIFTEIEIPRVLKEDELIKHLINYKSEKDSAKELLITHNIRLVIFIANKYKSKCDGANIEYEDLITIGIEGLIKGLNNFDLIELEKEKKKLIKEDIYY